jgi:hypothetical protein
MYRTTILGIIVLLSFIFASRVDGQGTAQMMTSKSIPPATVAVIDPESGTSSGGGNTDVKVAVGDIILFRFNYTPISQQGTRGMQGYLTEYIPANTQVVGVRIINRDGVTIAPRYPGISVDGCKGGAECVHEFKNMPCNPGLPSMNPACVSNKRELNKGSISQLYAETGVFYTTDSRLTRNPNNTFITLNNGGLMSPQPTRVSDIISVLGASTSTIYAHNAWDWIQVRAYGDSSAICGNDGYGITPYLFGSPVAGADTFYQYEASEPSAGVIQLNDTHGPWLRIKYPGSQMGDGSSSHSDSLRRMNKDTNLGVDVTPANPLPDNTTAVRFALGETRIGEPGFAEVALKVLDTPLDPHHGADADCGEVFGSDISAESDTDATSNPWSFYLASPSCVYLNLLFDLTVDRPLATNTDPTNLLTYTLHVKNLSLLPQTGVEVWQRYGNDLAYVSGSANGSPESRANCAGDGRACLVWSLGTLQPSDEFEFTSQFTVVGASGGGAPTAVMSANFVSSSLPDPGFQTQAVSVTKGMVVLDARLQSQTPMATAVGTASFTGTVQNTVIATGIATVDSISLNLPEGWSLTESKLYYTPPGDSEKSCNVGSTSTPICDGLNIALDPNSSIGIQFRTNIPGGTAADLYHISLQTWAHQGSFGKFESYFPNIVTQPVGKTRSNPPVVTCPINRNQTTISGTTDATPNATVRVYINGIQRGGDLVVSSSNWTLSSFGDFGRLYSGAEIRATAQGNGELESELSEPCYVSVVNSCSDGIDNDDDGKIDFPEDIGCDSPNDNDEGNHPECSDGIDNDGSHGTDYPNDPSCTSPYDQTEDGVFECNDGVDNDGDGFTDYPSDLGCDSESGPNEVDFPACSNGQDDDGDELTDFPDDPGCYSATDDDETDIVFPTGDISPRILLLFDTSGSMNWLPDTPTFTGGDGSVECPGVGSSRLQLVKQGVTDVVSAFGEVQYALMRFHQRAIPFACPTSNASLGSGGWQGAGAAPCTGFNYGDVLVGFSPDNPYSILEYIDEQSNYPSISSPPVVPWGMDFELRGSGTTPIAGSLVSALDYIENTKDNDDYGDCRPYRVILVTDGAETCGGDPVEKAGDLIGADIKLNVIGFATTDPEIVANLDAIAAAGSEDGLGMAVLASDATQLSMVIASIIADSILVERCNGKDDDCDGQVDEGFQINEPCSEGTGACENNGTIQCISLEESACSVGAATPTTEVCDDDIDNDCDGQTDCADVDCVHEAICACVPQIEVCNGLDDDCDGLTDEEPLPGVGDECGSDIGECTKGVLYCDSESHGLKCSGQGPVTETCDGLDNDCDGFIDGFDVPCYVPQDEEDDGCVVGSGCKGECRTGWSSCEKSSGKYDFGACIGQVNPVVELCNGIDDDCDGETDEDWVDDGLHASCDNGQKFGCLTHGTYECGPDGASVTCTAPSVTPGPEVCNGSDDDCDGETDEAEDLDAPVGNACGGICSGVLICKDGEIVCSTQGGSTEVCDGLDNDCDGFIDEGDLPDTGEDCADDGMEDVGDVGLCEFGKTACVDGRIVCNGYVGPADETCNGEDDDCDGVVDNEAVCPTADDICYEGSCISPCTVGEFSCGYGFYCKTLEEGDYCVSDPCTDIECASDRICDEDTGSCVDACSDSHCKEGESCLHGVCVDCYRVPCELGQICRPNAIGVGVCESDGCARADCDSQSEVCDNGTCRRFECSPACASGQSCINGLCKTDKCAAVSCSSGQICNTETGSCVANGCLAVSCLRGKVCEPISGQCVLDPCDLVRCPRETQCQTAFDGSAICQRIRSSTDGDAGKGEQHSLSLFATGGGGVACSVSGPKPNSHFGLALLLISLISVSVRTSRERRKCSRR